jgi:hypothetical protein
MHKLVAVSLLLVAGSLQAAPVTIDFEERSVGDSGSDIFDPIQSMGFDYLGRVCCGPGGNTDWGQRHAGFWWQHCRAWSGWFWF